MKQRGKYNWPPIPTYLCSLDAEGAYDQIPHFVLFDCADAFPDACWRVMLNWYTKLEPWASKRLGVNARDRTVL